MSYPMTNVTFYFENTFLMLCTYTRLFKPFILNKNVLTPYNAG